MNIFRQQKSASLGGAAEPSEAAAARPGSRQLGRRFVVAVVGASVATLALGVGAAQAGVVHAGVQRAPIAVLHGPIKSFPLRYATPTANLDKIANSLQLKHKSITTLITVPAGLGVTHPVDITVTYDYANPITESYSNSGGARFLYNFPSGLGRARYRTIFVNLVEHVSATQTKIFDFFQQPFIEPLYDITVSPATFHLDNGCDWIGSSEPVIEWNDPQGRYGEADLSLDGGQTATIYAFQRHYSEVGQLAGLRTPAVVWWEDDPFSVGAVPPAQTGHLLPGTSFTYSLDSREATGQDCTGRLTYHVTDTLRFYPFL